MKAGRELDTLVAEKALGLKVCEKRWGKTKQFSALSLGEPDYYDDQGEMILSNPLPRYSEDIAAAWEVVEKLQTESIIELNAYRNSFYVSVNKSGNEIPEVIAESDTAPHAICLAALKAVGAL